MKKIVLASCVILLTTVPIFAQDFLMGEETKGLKVKISDETDFSLRLRMQPRIDGGDLVVNKTDGKYESEQDLYLRRIRLEMNGKLTQTLKYDLTLEMDKNGIRGKDAAAKSNETKVQYAFLDYKFNDAANIRFGKAKLPYSRVSLTSSSKQLIVERPVSTEAGKKLFDDYYQTNLMFHGNAAEGIFAYNLALADGWENGNLLNGKDVKDGKVLKSDLLYIARIELSPIGFVEKGKSDAWLGKGNHVTLGLNYAAQKNIKYSHFGTTAATNSLVCKDKADNSTCTIKPTDAKDNISNEKEDRSYLGTDLSAHFGGITLQTEYTALSTKYSQAGVEKAPKGWYVQGGYFMEGINIEPVVRYEQYDHDSKAAGKDKKEKDTTVGINWYAKGHSFKIGANWVHVSYGKDAKEKDSDKDSKNIYQIQSQLYF